MTKTAEPKGGEKCEKKIATAARGDAAPLRVVVLTESEAESQSLREFGRSKRAFARIWDNPDDAEYNKL